MKAIRVTSTEKLASGATAMLIATTKIDSYRLNNLWGRADLLAHNTAVDEIDLAGQLRYAVGEQLIVKSIAGDVVAQVEIAGIRLVDVDMLPDAMFRQVGYASRDDYLGHWGKVYGKRCWWFEVRYI